MLSSEMFTDKFPFFPTEILNLLIQYQAAKRNQCGSVKKLPEWVLEAGSDSQLNPIPTDFHVYGRDKQVCSLVQKMVLFSSF